MQGRRRPARRRSGIAANLGALAIATLTVSTFGACALPESDSAARSVTETAAPHPEVQQPETARAEPAHAEPERTEPERPQAMQLGAFSISLAVKDLAASRTFYEKLGFEPVGGDGQNWQILRQGTTTLGLFQGMFEKNCLTFNPGWNAQAEALDSFQDVRDIQAALLERGVELAERADASGTGPAHITMVDPDGNPILIDQHVARPQQQ